VNRQEHWEKVYTERQPNEVSWYQVDPKLSLDLIHHCGLSPEACILDVGAGASVLVDRLVEEGHSCLGVLDIASSALDKAKTRLGAKANGVFWQVGDVTGYSPDREYELWHDRAVFHFMVTDEDRQNYLKSLRASLKPGGWVVLAAFAPDGPEKCSGLPVQRYDADLLLSTLGQGFELKEQASETHKTPWDSEQKFNYFLLQRAA
jgi:SAM-dependent methyltransferase